MLVEPTVTLPNETLAGLDPSSPSVRPVPERAMFKLGFVPFELMVNVPLAAPAAAGLNATVNDALWPALKVCGRDSPLSVNPPPVADAAEMVTLEPPVFVKVPPRDFELPICTLPKDRPAGFGVSAPEARPTPEKEIVIGELDAFETICMFALADPAALGEKVTENGAL